MTIGKVKASSQRIGDIGSPEKYNKLLKDFYLFNYSTSYEIKREDEHNEFVGLSTATAFQRIFGFYLAKILENNYRF